jgi:hypothetical protein
MKSQRNELNPSSILKLSQEKSHLWIELVNQLKCVWYCLPKQLAPERLLIVKVGGKDVLWVSLSVHSTTVVQWHDRVNQNSNDYEPYTKKIFISDKHLREVGDTRFTTCNLILWPVLLWSMTLYAMESTKAQMTMTYIQRRYLYQTSIPEKLVTQSDLDKLRKYKSSIEVLQRLRWPSQT